MEFFLFLICISKIWLSDRDDKLLWEVSKDRVFQCNFGVIKWWNLVSSRRCLGFLGSHKGGLFNLGSCMGWNFDFGSNSKQDDNLWKIVVVYTNVNGNQPIILSSIVEKEGLCGCLRSLYLVFHGCFLVQWKKSYWIDLELCGEKEGKGLENCSFMPFFKKLFGKNITAYFLGDSVQLIT